MAHLGPHLRHYAPPLGPPTSSEDPPPPPPPSPPASPELIEPLSDTFEIEDFTALSDWEKFVAGFEDILRDWGVSHYNPRPDSAHLVPAAQRAQWVWRQTRREIRLMDCGFWVTRFVRSPDVQAGQSPTDPVPPSTDSSAAPWPWACQSLMNGEGDFPCSAHPVHYFYGLEEYITFSPQGSEQVDNPTRIKMILSTLSVAAHNTECAIPMFIQIMKRHQAQFAGLCVNDRFRTMFEMAVLPKVPSSCRNLSEILYVFQEKLSQPISMSVRGCRCTLRRTYLLEDWTSHAWTQSPPDLELFAMFGGQLGFLNDLRHLPFGAGQDPVKRLLLNTTWPGLVEETVLENDVHNDLDPLEAPNWSVSVQFEEQPLCLLGQYLNQFAKVSENHESMVRVLGDYFSQSDYDVDESVDNVPNALKRLTGPTYGLSDIIKSGRSRRNSNQPGPIKDEYLFKILEYLFPDSTDKPEFPYPEDFGTPSHPHNENFNNFRVLLSTIKSSPVDGLLWRFTIVAAHCLHILGGIKPLAHLMHEFMLEIRFRWENGRKLPGLPNGPPDHSYCLFHQKLQMINYCIDRKLARESGPNQSSVNDTTSKTDENSDEEFYDCDEDEEIEVDASKTNTSDLPIWNQKPEGRSERMGKTKLLHHNDFIYVPICQEPAPMTDDQLAELAEILLQLGSDTEGSELRAKMQSASLLSDMESFKAANPGSVLADFVRWHSPRDWIETEGEGGEKGKLSLRMTTPGNAWAEAWESAKPVPARRQKRLFDDTREAEKAIKFLTSLKPGEATQTLMPTFLHAAIHRLLLETLDNVPNLKDIIGSTMPLLARLARFSCRPEVQHYSSDVLPEFDTRANLVRDVVQRLVTAEIKLSQALSLRAKFTKDANFVKKKAQPDDQEQVAKQMEDFVRQLYTSPEVKVVGASRGPAGQLIQKMFKEAEKATQMITDDMESMTDEPLKVFPAPVSREYIIRTVVPRPFPYSAKSPQRLYVCIKDKEFRLAGAFTLAKEYL